MPIIRTGLNLFQRLFPAERTIKSNPNDYVDYSQSQLQDIWLAGGCFWGIEAYMDRVYGIAETTAGYANGTTENPKYEEIGQSGHAETVHIRYDPERISLEGILSHYFQVIDPTQLNRQGNDSGTQYRTGIYYTNEQDRAVIEQFVAKEQEKYDKIIVTEVQSLQGFYLAESYHQDYLEKNPGGYCHIQLDSILDRAPEINPDLYSQPDESLLALQDPLVIEVTRYRGTEPAFQNEYWDTKDVGLYVDALTGEPLFLSSNKFESGTGWPSFTQPVVPEVVREVEDRSQGMVRTEVRSRVGDNHLGHVFADGPADRGGMRYCINSAALRFIPVEEMDREGYGHLILFALQQVK